MEWHDLVRKTGFNIFASQGNQNAIMQMTTMKVINRKVDADIIGELDSGATNHAGATAVTMSLNLLMRAWTILGNNFVPVEEEDNMYAVLTPAAFAYMMQVKEFAHADYVDVKPFAGSMGKRYRRYAGMNFITHPNLTGVGTATEKCYLFHRAAIGHAVNAGDIKSPVGYMEEHDYSWARASVYMGSKTLQAAGIVQVLHDGSAYVAT